MTMHTVTRNNVLIDNILWNVSATYGIHSIENQNPYFSITGEATSEEGDETFGQITDILLPAFPWLEFMTQMHLRDAETGEPMYAKANGWYWFTEEDNLPDTMKGLTKAQRAANYLGCDPSHFADLTTEDSNAFVERVDELKPAWKIMADAAKMLYNL